MLIYYVRFKRMICSTIFTQFLDMTTDLCRFGSVGVIFLSISNAYLLDRLNAFYFFSEVYIQNVQIPNTCISRRIEIFLECGMGFLLCFCLSVCSCFFNQNNNNSLLIRNIISLYKLFARNKFWFVFIKKRSLCFFN